MPEIKSYLILKIKPKFGYNRILNPDFLIFYVLR